MDIYGDAAHCQFKETVCPDGFSEALADLVIVPLANLRPAKASGYPPEPKADPLTTAEAMKAWVEADNPKEMAQAVEAVRTAVTFEEEFALACPDVGYITLDIENDEMMELMRSPEGRARVSAAIDEALAARDRER